EREEIRAQQTVDSAEKEALTQEIDRLTQINLQNEVDLTNTRIHYDSLMQSYTQVKAELSEASMQYEAANSLLQQRINLLEAELAIKVQELSNEANKQQKIEQLQGDLANRNQEYESLLQYYHQVKAQLEPSADEKKEVVDE